MNKLSQLPSELISLILAHVDKRDLYACTLINTLFYWETMPLLWRQLDIDSDVTLDKVTTTMATSPHSPGDHVRGMVMTFNLSDAALLAFSRHVPFVEEMRLLVADDISDTSLQHVPRYCPHLTILCLHRAFDITQLSMVAIGQYCHQLSTIELVLCPSLDAEPLFDALRACPLKEISLLLCHLNYNKNPHLFQATAFALQHHRHRLTCLRIQDITDDHTPFITTANTHGLVWPHLTHFSLDACDTLDDTMIIRFMQAHPQLQYLELGNNHKITDHTLDAIHAYLPDIREVGVHGLPRLTAAGICRLVKNCATLKHGIHCSGCGIYPQDGGFPKDMDKRFYLLDMDFETQLEEVVWIAGNAFDDTHGN